MAQQIRFNDEVVQKIAEKIAEKKQMKHISTEENGEKVGYDVHNWGGRTAVFSEETGYLACELTDLPRAIKELTLILEAVEEVTGLTLV